VKHPHEKSGLTDGERSGQTIIDVLIMANQRIKDGTGEVWMAVWNDGNQDP
jgi:hypothetical protein